MQLASNMTTNQHRPHVRRLGRGQYAIESRTTPGVVYTVTLTGRDTHTCTCRAHEFGRDCWHSGVARQLSRMMEAWYAQAVTPASTRVAA